jgi:undecaprenyl-diphosphatase
LNSVEAFILGIVQGLSEFLPVSSSGHLVIVQSLMHVEQEGILFEIAVHVATLASVLIFYRARVASLIRGTLRLNRPDLEYVGKLAVATIPAVLLVLVAGDFIDQQFESPVSAGVGLLITGAILWSTRWTLGTARLPSPTWTAALLIGCAQSIAIAPGISRSGATVAAALALGVNPLAAAEFSFLMSSIAITGAAVRMIPEFGAISSEALFPIALGMIAALISGIAAIWLFVRLLQSSGFHYFAYYTWSVGALAVIWFGLL